MAGAEEYDKQAHAAEGYKSKGCCEALVHCDVRCGCGDFGDACSVASGRNSLAHARQTAVSARRGLPTPGGLGASMRGTVDAKPFTSTASHVRVCNQAVVWQWSTIEGARFVTLTEPVFDAGAFVAAGHVRQEWNQ